MSIAMKGTPAEPTPGQAQTAYYAHPSAVVSSSAKIGRGTKIWCFCQIRENAVLGEGCNLGKGVYVDVGVIVGDRVKIQNNVSLYYGVQIESGVFVGPHVCFTNDRVPRAVTITGEAKALEDWDVSPILVKYGASLGAHSVILPGVTIGKFAMVAAGTVVTKDVPDHALVMGNPSRIAGFVCACGNRLPVDSASGSFACKSCSGGGE